MHVPRAWFSNVLERIARDPRDEPFAPGDLETTDRFTARILEVNEHGAPRRVRYQFNTQLEDPRPCWLRLEGTHAMPWTPPAIHEEQHIAAAGLL